LKSLKLGFGPEKNNAKCPDGIDMSCNNLPFLSLCIPTFNRAWYLEKALDYITSQRIFQDTHAIEVCISDNASTDNTAEVASRYKARFGSKIVYSRNSENVHDKNFELALSLGSGTFLKLCNDTCWYKTGMLESMLRHVQQWQDEKPILFFKESEKKHGSTELYGLDAFVDAVSYYMCSTNSFGIWKEDFDKLDDFSRFSSRSFAQVDVFLRLIARKKKVVLVRDDFFYAVWPPAKGGYNFAQVFGDNYISLLRENGVTESAVRREQVRSLRHIVRYYFNFNGCYRFQKTGYMPYMRSYYGLPAFWLAFLRVIKKKAIAFVQKIFCSELSLFRKQWKIFYPYNSLRPACLFPILAVQAGRYATGDLHVQASDDAVGTLLIDDYARLDEDVRFECGSRPIVVEKAVRIGKGARILEGVRIGMGAVVAPGSVVDAEIPAFAVVAGNPASFRDWRFPEQIRTVMKDFSLSSVSPDSINRDPDELFSLLSAENACEILRRYQR